ncbi:hypothetical protein PZB74_10310 [Porifericola rhodea]|uniref:fibronectin type III domain-containing protein n=1 Tax=Porifericola rhodea TaxID=930972 RepID=UPI002666EEFB|nr:hypothetical protein [Porifericola rhodea]WKN33717.1 hypothetical protein PZB74_10310 [Porifericola rhodea]
MAVFSTLCKKGALLYLLLSFTSLQAQQVIFSDNFEEGGFHPQWQIHPGQKNGAIEVVPSGALEGKFAARLGKSTDGEYTLNRLDIPLKLSTQQQYTLQMMLYSNHEETQVQDGIFLSVDNGATFEKIYAFTFDKWHQKHGGYLPPLNLNALARRQNLLLSEHSIIRIQQYGKDDFNGGQDYSDGLYIDDISISAQMPIFAKLPYSENFEDFTFDQSSSLTKGDPGLSDSTLDSSLNGLIDVVNFEDSPNKVLRMGSSMDKSPTTNAINLYLNLATYQHAKLAFDIYDNRDETHLADGIFFSDNGGLSYHKVYALDFDNWSDDHFGSLPPLDIRSLAQKRGLQLNEHFVIRFQQHDDDDFEGSRLSSDGLMLDNIRVYDDAPQYSSLPFEENFEDSVLAPFWRVGTPTGVVKPNGLVELTKMEDGNQAIRLGSRADKCFTTNALDLYVNLLDKENATLSFDYYDNYDETHAEDGIFFSNDGGASFKKVFNFDGDNWTDKQFGTVHSLNIQELASRQNIALSQNFVIRFQQYDDDDFEGTRTISDGIYLDNIQIIEPKLEFAQIPLLEDFEATTLPSYWNYGNPTLTAALAHVKPDGIAQVLDSVGVQTSRGLALGRLKDGKTNTNAIDLNLNLSRQHNLELSFKLYNNYDISDKEDGIWFSNNGGKSFVKAWTYPNRHASFQTYVLNFDSLAIASGVQFSDHFVVRFQQSGDRKFAGSGSLKGGIYLDDITVARAIPRPEIHWPPLAEQPTMCDKYFFQWSEIMAAEAYNIQVYTYNQGKEIVIQDTVVNETSFTVSGLEQDSAYFCRLKANNAFTESKWSSPITFRTFTVFEADVQVITAKASGNSVILQANELPSCEYQWYKNGEPIDNGMGPKCKVEEPGEYAVYISNQSCGMMSKPLEVKPQTLGFYSSTSPNAKAYVPAAVGRN